MLDEYERMFTGFSSGANGLHLLSWSMRMLQWIVSCSDQLLRSHKDTAIVWRPVAWWEATCLQTIAVCI